MLDIDKRLLQHIDYACPMIDIYSEIRKRYGNIRRARGYYLYTEKNIRLFDLWLDGGKAVLGRKTGQANLVCKQFLDRGLTGFVPTKADDQLLYALKALLPEYSVIRWYDTEDKAERIIRALLHKDETQDIPVWRPFLEDTEYHRIALITPAYPVSCGIIAADRTFEELLPLSDRLFPPLVYSLARAFFDIRRKIDETVAASNADVGGKSEKKSVPMSKKRYALLKRREAVVRLIPIIWERKSCYLFPRIPKAEYAALFFEALDAHILISPEYGKPSILPDCESYAELIRFLQARS